MGGSLIDLNGKGYLEPQDVLKRIGDGFTIDDILHFIELGYLDGTKHEDSWLVDERDATAFIGKFRESNAFYLGFRRIDLKDVRLKGRILDIGGGGEGVIGQLAGEDVIAIDKLRSELEEASGSDCIKIVMDATDMGFMDGTFDTATAFFSFMFMGPNDLAKVLGEARRVLKDGGEFHIWDMRIPKRPRGGKEFYVILLLIDIGGKVISTGYGAKWDRTQDAGMLCSMAIEQGFRVIESKEDGELFHIRLLKAADKDKNVKSEISD